MTPGSATYAPETRWTPACSIKYRCVCVPVHSVCVHRCTHTHTHACLAYYASRYIANSINYAKEKIVVVKGISYSVELACVHYHHMVVHREKLYQIYQIVIDISVFLISSGLLELTVVVVVSSVALAFPPVCVPLSVKGKRHRCSILNHVLTHLTNPVSSHIVLIRTNVINLLNRVPERDRLTFIVLHRTKC